MTAMIETQKIGRTRQLIQGRQQIKHKEVLDDQEQ
jgi:hypothetical protein